MVVIDTPDGPCGAVWAQCPVCEWSGFAVLDLGVEIAPDGSVVCDDETEEPCPRCGLHEMTIEHEPGPERMRAVFGKDAPARRPRPDRPD